MARHRIMADGTWGRITTIPARTGHGRDYRSLYPDVVHTISARTTLCPAIPASKTTRHGRPGPGHHHLQTSTPDQSLSLGLSTMHQGLSYLGIRVRRDPSTAVQPRHQPSLGLVHSQSTTARTFATTPTPRQSWSSHDAQDRM